MRKSQKDKIEERAKQLQAARKEKYRNRYNNPDRQPAQEGFLGDNR